MSRAKIRFQDVSFSYGAIALRCTASPSTCNPREKLAIVGRSGRQDHHRQPDPALMEPDKGRILIRWKGHFQRSALNDIRDNIALVSQTFSVRSSIRDNIRDGARTPLIRRSSPRRASPGVTSFALALSNGLDTLVGPGGTNLSGGQKQRVAIAPRAGQECPCGLSMIGNIGARWRKRKAVMEEPSTTHFNAR